MPCNSSSTVGIGYLPRVIALLAILMSMHSRILVSFAFRTTMTGFTHGAGPSTFSMMSMQVALGFSQVEWYLSQWLCYGLHIVSMCSLICLVLSLPTPVNSFALFPLHICFYISHCCYIYTHIVQLSLYLSLSLVVFTYLILL